MENEFGSPLLHPLLAGRWSPASFDPSYQVTTDEIDVLLEAARWAPSAGNSQPWAFIVGQRGDATHTRLVRHLAGSSARWAPAASVLVANLTHRYVADTDWEYSEFSLYDLGQAVAHMTLQAPSTWALSSPVPGLQPARGGRAVRCAPALGGHHHDRHRPGQGKPTTPIPSAGRSAAAGTQARHRHRVAGRMRTFAGQRADRSHRGPSHDSRHQANR